MDDLDRADDFHDLDSLDSMIMPVFPLKDMVLFPRVMLPLHIFESRYRQMVDDLLELPQKNRYVAISNLNYQGKAKGENPFEEIATVGKMIKVKKLDDGRSNIFIYGVFTAEIEEVMDNSEPYRICRVKEIREEFWKNPMSDRSDQRERFMEAVDDFSSRANIRFEKIEEVDLDDLINGISFTLQIDIDDKQELLEEQNLNQRMETLMGLLDNMGYYKEFTPDEDQYSHLN